jgi:hypothetical protein
VLDRISGEGNEETRGHDWLVDVLVLGMRLVFYAIVMVLALLPIVQADFHRPILPQLLNTTHSVSWWMEPLMAMAAFAGVVLAVSILRLLRIVTGWL